MPFYYKEVTVSGATAGLEGTSLLIQEIKDALVNEMGWNLTEDRSAEAGTGHKVILQSNGESGTDSTFYLVLTSGTTDEIGIQSATFWDTGTHTVGSGVASPANDTTVTLETDEDADYTAWISGDRDSVVLLTLVSTSYDATYAGRIIQFTDPTQDHFPVYTVGGATASVDPLTNNSNATHSFKDGTTIIVGTRGSWEGFYTSPLGTDSSPTNIFGQTEAYIALPIFVGVRDTINDFRSIRGVAANVWTTIGPNATGSTLTQQDEILAGDGKTYQVFFDSAASQRTLVIRKS